MSISTLDLPVITAGTVNVTNGSALVDLVGSTTAWDSGNNPVVGRGAWIQIAADSIMVKRLVSPTQLELMRQWTGSTGNSSYELTLPRGATDVLVAEVIRLSTLRYETVQPEDDLNFEAGGQRHRLVAESGGALTLRSGSSGTAWASLSTIETLTNLIAKYAARPQSGAGVGQVVTVIPAANAALTLPAGGTWAYLAILGNTSSGMMLTGQIYTGVNAGGGTVLGAQGANFQWNAWVWRIA